MKRLCPVPYVSLTLLMMLMATTGRAVTEYPISAPRVQPGEPALDYWNFSVDDDGNATLTSAVYTYASGWIKIDDNTTSFEQYYFFEYFRGSKIPERISDPNTPSISFPVVAIANGACCNHTGSSLTIPSCIKSIGKSVFRVDNLTTLKLNVGLETIGNFAFSGRNKVKTLTLPAGLRSIGLGAFQSWTYLKDLNFPATSMTIGTYAFDELQYDCNVNIRSLDMWCNNVFEGDTCIFSYGAPMKINGKLVTNLDSAKTIDNIPSHAFRDYQHFSGPIVIPSGVTNIGDYAFYNVGIPFDHDNDITSFTFPETLRTIGEKSFDNISSSSFEFRFLGPKPSLPPSTTTRADAVVIVFYDDSWKDFKTWDTDIRTGRVICTNEWACTFDLGGKARRIGGGELNQTVKYQVPLVYPELEVNEDYEFESWSSPFDGTGTTRLYTAQYTLRPLQTKGDLNLTLRRFSPDTQTTLGALGGVKPYRWEAVSGLPDGLTLSRQGILSGSTAFLGTTDLTIRITDSAGTQIEQTYSLTLLENPNPVITPEDGMFFTDDSCDVSLMCRVSGATLYWTLDGTEPAIDSSCLYTGPRTISDTTSIQAIAVVENEIIGRTTATIFHVADELLPDLGSSPTDAGLRQAFANATDEQLLAYVRTGTSYAGFRIWAKSLSTQRGLALSEIIAHPHVWQSYALDQNSLLTRTIPEEDLVMNEISAPAADGSFLLSLSVKNLTIGSDALAENLKLFFGLKATTDLRMEFLPENLSLELAAPPDTEAIFTAAPAGDIRPSSFYMTVPQSR